MEFIKNNYIKTPLFPHSWHIAYQLQYGKGVNGTNHCLSKESCRTGTVPTV